MLLRSSYLPKLKVKYYKQHLKIAILKGCTHGIKASVSQDNEDQVNITNLQQKYLWYPTGKEVSSLHPPYSQSRAWQGLGGNKPACCLQPCGHLECDRKGAHWQFCQTVAQFLKPGTRVIVGRANPAPTQEHQPSTSQRDIEPIRILDRLPEGP